MNTIINPIDGKEYSLYSTRGRELLKLYINNYKSGGSATIAGSPWIFENVKQFFSNTVDGIKGLFKKRDDTLETRMRDHSNIFTTNPIFEAPETVIDKQNNSAREIPIGKNLGHKTTTIINEEFDPILPTDTIASPKSPSTWEKIRKSNRDRSVHLTALKSLHERGLISYKLEEHQERFLTQQKNIS